MRGSSSAPPTAPAPSDASSPLYPVDPVWNCLLTTGSSAHSALAKTMKPVERTRIARTGVAMRL